MAPSKQPSSKKQKQKQKQKQNQKQKKGAIDFKKIKRKLGRKLPPKNNSTNTEVKSKAIILPEQSVASDKSGLAVSRKGLTLKELLQQTSHHNAKVRRDALLGIKDLSMKHPSELKPHKLVILDKLFERINDDDKVVRQTLYELLKSVIFPCFTEEMPGHVISLIRAHIFTAMTNRANDIRIMAFKFFNLVVEHYPSSFFSYAEEVLQKYEEMLRNNLKHLHEKSKFKIVLGGLVHCMSLLDSDRRKNDRSCEQVTDVQQTLHAFEPDPLKGETGVSLITDKLKGLLPILTGCYQEIFQFVHKMSTAETQSFDCMLGILQSINLVIKYFVHRVNKPHANYGISMQKISSLTTWGASSIPVLLKKLFETFPLNGIYYLAEKEDRKCYALNVEIAIVFLHVDEWIGSPAYLKDRFLEFIKNMLSCQEICVYTRSNRLVLERHLALVLPFIPKLLLEVSHLWKFCLLEAFTKAFIGCEPGSTLKLAFISAIEEMLLPAQRSGMMLFVDCQDMTQYQATWMQELSKLLIQLGDLHPSTSKVVLLLLLRVGQCTPVGSTLAVEYDRLQPLLIEFFCFYVEESDGQGRTRFGPFVKLPKDCQETAICCLYYFSQLDLPLVKSLSLCCLCGAVEPFVIFRTIEVLSSVYKAGRMQITEHLSFLVTIISSFRVFAGRICPSAEDDGRVPNHATFKAITELVCSCLCQIGDRVLTLKLLQKTVLSEMSMKRPMDNMRAMLKIFVVLDSKPTRLLEESENILSSYLSGYLVDATSCIPENVDETAESDWKLIFLYYVQPAFCMLQRNANLLSRVLNLLGSSIVETDSTHSLKCIKYTRQIPSRVYAVTSILLFMHRDVKMRRSLTSCKLSTQHILQTIISLQTTNEIDMNIQERCKIKNALEQLKAETRRIHLWDVDDFRCVL